MLRRENLQQPEFPDVTNPGLNDRIPVGSLLETERRETKLFRVNDGKTSGAPGEAAGMASCRPEPLELVPNRPNRRTPPIRDVGRRTADVKNLHRPRPALDMIDHRNQVLGQGRSQLIDSA